MASMRLACLLLVLFTAWHQIAHARQDGGEAADVHSDSTGMGFLTGEPAAISKRFGGRKMAIDAVVRLEKVNAHGADVGTFKISPSNQFAERCDKKVVSVSNVKCYQGVSHHPIEVNEAGFVAFNADYGEPSHHPPKNN